MTKPDLKLDQMQELKPVQETKSAMETAAEAIPNAASPKKAKFVQRMEDSAQANASNSAVTETPQQPAPGKTESENTELENPASEKLEPERYQTAEPTHCDKTAETEDSVQAVVDSDKEEATVSEPKSEEQISEVPRIENVIRFLRVHRNAPKLIALMRKDYHTADVEVVIRKSTQEQLRALADALS